MTVRKGTRWGVILIAIIVAAAFVVECARGQSLKGEGSAGLVAWASHDRCYQHAIEADSRLKFQYWHVSAEAYLDVKWWGACDSKIESSFLNAEAGKVIERSHGVIVGGYPTENLFVGAGIIRSAVHHFWRNGRSIRKKGFPPSDDASVAKMLCRRERECASLGYYEGLRPVVRYTSQPIYVSVMGPQYRWKNLTLPWPQWIVRASYRWREWTLSMESEIGGVSDTVVDGALQRSIGERVTVGARYGTLNTPGWRESLRRLAVSVRVGV